MCPWDLLCPNSHFKGILAEFVKNVVYLRIRNWLSFICSFHFSEKKILNLGLFVTQTGPKLRSLIHMTEGQWLGHFRFLMPMNPILRNPGLITSKGSYCSKKKIIKDGMIGDELGTSFFFTYFSWLTSTSEGGKSIFGRK